MKICHNLTVEKKNILDFALKNIGFKNLHLIGDVNQNTVQNNHQSFFYKFLSLFISPTSETFHCEKKAFLSDMITII